MSKINYLIKRIINIDYKNMFKIARKVSDKNGNSYIYTIFDMVRCGLVYQAGYYDYQEFEFYNLNKEERKTYLTRGKNNEIVKRFNNKDNFYKFEKKDIFNELFKSFIKRDWLVLNDNNYEEFLNFLKDKKEIIVKPIDDEGGNGIEKIVYDDKLNTKEIFDYLLKTNRLLIEECIAQHDKMSELYDKSVNTLRMFTFIDNDNVYFLQAVLKIGNGGVIDNFGGGGMYTFVDDNGVVITSAFDKEDNAYDIHPISKCPIKGFEVPLFDEAIKLVKDAAKLIPDVGYIGWDVAISKDGPVIVEGNCFPGIFQMKPSLSKDKIGLVPKYNKVMKIF